MAKFLNGFLDNLGKGLTNPKGNLGDFQHAAKLYNSQSFRLAPKVKFLYHVVFNFNPQVTSLTNFTSKHQNAVGLLVKAVDLPKFKVTVDNPHQYNRKKQVQTKLEYEPITITLHDDNLGVTTALWALYYGYYFKDSSHGGSAGATAALTEKKSSLSSFIGNIIPVGQLLNRLTGGRTNSGTDPGTPPAYKKNTYRGPLENSFGYGLDNNSSVPFFTSIQIFQLSRKQYQSFTLINPIITGWQHDKLDNSVNETVANTMQIAYEAVIYGTGAVQQGIPKNFGTEYYDKSPSPLTLLGGGKVGLFGQGGILAGAADIVGGIATGDAFKNPSAFLGTLVKGASVLKATKSLSKESIRREAFGLVEGAVTSATGINVGGVANVVFPKSSGRGQTQLTGAQLTQRTQSNGPLERTKVETFFNNRPGSLDALAKSTIFQKEIGAGSLSEANARWAALSPAARAEYQQRALEKVINGAPEVQYQYNLIKSQR